MTKKILFIGYHYPPDRAIGAQRIAQFVKYLPEMDVEPYVVTVLDKYYLQKDTEHSSYIDGNVMRTRVLPWFRDIYKGLRDIFKRRQTAEVVVSEEKVVTERKEDGKESLVDKVRRNVFSFFWLPDDKVGWTLPGCFAAIRLLRKENIGTYLTTGPPHSTHLIGLLVKLITGKKWLVDLRDPWVTSGKNLAVRTKLSDTIERWLEKKVVNNSDLLICVTPEMAEYYQQRYATLTPETCVTIYNGYDFKEIENLKITTKYPKITFTYTGTLYLDRNPDLFLEAVSELLAAGMIAREEISIRLVGNCRYIKGRSIDACINTLYLTDVVKIVDPVPRSEALLEAAKSHVLLLFAQKQPLQVPGKLFEYIGLDAYVLGICEKGASYSVLQKYEKAAIVDGQDVGLMKDAILSLLKKVRSSEAVERADQAYSLQYRRDQLTCDLARFV